MFRKLISELSFSSSLMGELGRYAHNLKREEYLRFISIWTTLFAAIITSLLLFFPPSSANTTHPNDLIRGGVGSKQEFMQKYNNNEYGIQQITASLGISSSNISNTIEGAVEIPSLPYTTGRIPNDLYGAGEHIFSYLKPRGETGVFYVHPPKAFNIPIRLEAPAIIGTSESTGKFAILLSSGNVLLEKIPDTPHNMSDTIFTYEKTAYNTTQGNDASTNPAQPRDRITYTLTATNTSSSPADLQMTDNVADIVDYADIIDTDGGIFDEETYAVSWFAPTINPGETYSRTLSARIKPHIAATAQGISNPSSYDCMMTNNFGTSSSILVACPAVKQVEQLSRGLPTVSPLASVIGGSLIFALALFLYFRARMLREEVRLIRKDINSGTLS